MKQFIALVGADIVTPFRIIKKSAIVIEDNLIYEMGKMSESGKESFSEKYAAGKAIYIEGEKIRKKLFKLDKQEKRKIPKENLKSK